ncbi:hypothetical protein [Nitrosomonas aestuarii]|nr:hypothetical protein [Nitrosomonas aestuarii]
MGQIQKFHAVRESRGDGNFRIEGQAGFLGGRQLTLVFVFNHQPG